MTMRLSGPHMALCDLCNYSFIHTPGDPIGLIRHSDYAEPRCADAGKLFELPILQELIGDGMGRR